MDRMKKIPYLLITLFFGGLGIHKFLNGRIVPAMVHMALSFVLIGILLGIIECIVDIFKLKSDEDGRIDIPTRFFDFL